MAVQSSPRLKSSDCSKVLMVLLRCTKVRNCSLCWLKEAVKKRTLTGHQKPAQACVNPSLEDGVWQGAAVAFQIAAGFLSSIEQGE